MQRKNRTTAVTTDALVPSASLLKFTIWFLTCSDVLHDVEPRLTQPRSKLRKLGCSQVLLMFSYLTIVIQSALSGNQQRSMVN